MEEVGGAVRACTALNIFIVFVREPTTFQYRLSLEIMNG